MKVKISKGCKFRQEKFGGIIRVPIEKVISTGQTFYRIDEIGYIILSNCGKRKTIDEISELIADEYGILIEVAKQDTIQFVRQLIEIGILKEVFYDRIV